MTVETATYLDSLSSANPGISDQIPEGDDHLRLIKAVLKSTFPGRGGEEGRTIVKAAGFTPALTEVGATFVSTGTLAVTLAALAGLPDGTFYNFAAQTGTTTLTPNGADTINGTTTFVLTVGQSCEIVKQGTNWVVLAASSVAPRIGIGQTWQNVSGSRSLATLYTNSTDRPIQVSVIGRSTILAVMSLTIGGVGIASLSIDPSYDGTVTGIVPPGVTYRVDMSSVSVLIWFELRA